MHVGKVGYVRGGELIDDYSIDWEIFEEAQPVRIQVKICRSGIRRILGVQSNGHTVEFAKATPKMLHACLTSIQEEAHEHLGAEAHARALGRLDSMRHVAEVQQRAVRRSFRIEYCDNKDCYCQKAEARLPKGHK